VIIVKQLTSEIEVFRLLCFNTEQLLIVSNSIPSVHVLLDASMIDDIYSW
jgi:hypothetical protein